MSDDDKTPISDLLETVTGRRPESVSVDGEVVERTPTPPAQPSAPALDLDALDAVVQKTRDVTEGHGVSRSVMAILAAAPSLIAAARRLDVVCDENALASAYDSAESELASLREEVVRLEGKVLAWRDRTEALERELVDHAGLRKALREVEAFAKDRQEQAGTWEETPQRGSVDYDARKILEIVGPALAASPEGTPAPDEKCENCGVPLEGFRHTFNTPGTCVLASAGGTGEVPA